MIQIDDSGSGSLLGGTCIGAMRVETGEYVYDFIPLEYYDPTNFRTKKYLNKASEIVFSLLESLDFKKNEEDIFICQGYMFELVRKSFAEKNINFTNTKITDPLQTLIEETFQEYALSLGLPPKYVKYTKYPLHFHRILRWVYADYYKRSPLCKTGWKSWKRYGVINVKVSKNKIIKTNYVCLKCGLEIIKGSRVKNISYYSNCPNTIYIHDKC